jgi:hypothetical protein
LTMRKCIVLLADFGAPAPNGFSEAAALAASKHNHVHGPHGWGTPKPWGGGRCVHYYYV